jgi:hypothetical protein
MHCHAPLDISVYHIFTKLTFNLLIVIKEEQPFHAWIGKNPEPLEVSAPNQQTVVAAS